MERLATVRWQGPDPAAVDEELAVYDDGTAWLAVRRPRQPTASIGSYAAGAGGEDLPGEDLASVAAAGPAPLIIELSARPQPSHGEAIVQAAERLAAAVRQHPRSEATFHCSVGGTDDQGRLRLALLVVGAGGEPIEFQLEPGRCAVHFSAGQQPVAWFELPQPQTGFVTPTAEGLGGLNRRAVVEPSAWGALSLALSAPPGADAVAVQVGGVLYEALPDEQNPERFEVRTDAVSLPARA